MGRVVVNMRHGTLVEGVFHRTLLVPEEAVREAIVNAVAHFNYSARQILPLRSYVQTSNINSEEFFDTTVH